MRQEQQPRRQEKVDMRVHACLYFIRPGSSSGLKPLDIETMKRLGSRVNLIPVIAKADTMSPGDLEQVKERVRRTIVAQGIKVYVPPVDEGDMASAEHSKALIVGDRPSGDATTLRVLLLTRWTFVCYLRRRPCRSRSLGVRTMSRRGMGGSSRVESIYGG